MQASPEYLREIVSHLTETIGVRLAGSDGERQAAEYLRGQMARFTEKAAIEYFPVNERHVEKEELEVFVEGRWQRFDGTLFSSAASTDGRPVEADIVYFDGETGYMQPDISRLRGKAVVHLGYDVNEEGYRRMMEAKPAFILFVDTRFPAAIPLSGGLFPNFVARYGSLPSVGVAFMDAWKWHTLGATRARLCVQGCMRPSQTSVVVAELPGTDPEAGVIYAGGHHDTQAGTVGADDNAIGSAAVVELTRLLSQRPHRRTFRLCSFGGEEQLSLGSAAYARAHRREIEEKGLFMCNFDAFGTALGWAEFTVNAVPAMEAMIHRHFNGDGLYYVEHSEPMPYTDQFPFAACGVPGIWIGRNNCPSGQFYHHRLDNTIDKLDFGISAQYVSAAAKLLAELGDAEDVSAVKGIPAEQQGPIDALFGEVFGGFQ